MVVGGQICSFDSDEARALRAKIVVALGASTVPPAVVKIFHERGVPFVPGALAAGGLFVALDLKARGVGDRRALASDFEAVHAQTASLLGRAAAAGKPLAGVVRTATRRPV